MPSLQETLNKHRGRTGQGGHDGESISETLLRHLKRQYDRTVGELMSHLGLDTGGDRGRRHEQHYAKTVLPDGRTPSENAAAATREVKRQTQIAEIPESRAQREAWAASPEGQAYRKNVEAMTPPAIKAVLDSPEAQERMRRTDDSLEALRDEMIERKSQGDPMTVKEYEERVVETTREVGREIRAEAQEARIARERAEPVHELNSVDQMQSHGERWSRDHEQGYSALREEVIERSAQGTPMTNGEYEDRWDHLVAKDRSREAEIPPTVEQVQAWRASPEGQAEASELRAYANAEKHEYAEIDRDKFDAAYGRLREEMLQRKADGDPMTSGEYRDRHQSALEDAGQHWRVAGWEADRADLRSIGEAPTPAQAERNPPVGQLLSPEQLEREGERFSDECRQDYQALYDETSKLNAQGKQMPEEELDRRLAAVYHAEADREAAIPPSIEEIREWRASPQGQAEARELKAASRNDAFEGEYGDSNAKVNQGKLDKSYEKLRAETIERRESGRPMTRGEFRTAYENAATDAGHTWGTARREAQRTMLRSASSRRERDQQDRSPGREPEVKFGDDIPTPGSAPRQASGSSDARSRDASAREAESHAR